MKNYVIKMRNNRSAKTLAGGLPVFPTSERFDSVEDAANAIFDGAFDIFNDEITGKIPEFEDDDDSEKFNEAWQAGMQAALADIVKNEGWSHDGVQYAIVEDVE